ncbi:MAG: hypothetical protein RIR41_2779 [Pseudomonadota bacterium]
MPDQEDIRPVALTVSGKTLALITGGGLLLGALIVVGAIMPAEFNTDPLGIGKASGISRLWAPEEKDFAGSGALATSSDAPKQSHIVDIPLGAADWKEAAIEYKVAMKPGQSIFYKWTATNLDGSPATVPVETDQHGHDLPAEGQPQTVIDYRKARLLADQGSLTAPIDGIFGWYFRNHSPDPIMIRLEIEGFYTLVPPGQPGNEFSIRPFDPNAAELQEDQ